MSDTHVTVTIGRNVDGEPMSDQEWADFQMDVHNLLSEVGPWTYGSLRQGLGDWRGVPEDDAQWTRVYPEWSVNLNWLNAQLDRLARKYGQETIAFSVGTSHLAVSR